MRCVYMAFTWVTGRLREDIDRAKASAIHEKGGLQRVRPRNRDAHRVWTPPHLSANTYSSVQTSLEMSTTQLPSSVDEQGEAQVPRQNECKITKCHPLLVAKSQAAIG
eukprot:GFKZ01000387.1.p1 GENE.GFKZ01000387.1~~GFKZ01000387.1.p1  ORF type:complete len:108 (+),score=1.92 GFKZ01000387.1:53-376(+)